MLRVITILLVLSFTAMICGTAAAEEGMWPLYDLGKLPYEKMKSMGLELTLDQIYNPNGPDVSDACINLSGGSSSFVSDEGLIITNHHVAFGAIQKQSTVETNYIKDGFYAASKAEEIPAIGYTVSVTLDVEEVTEKVLGLIKDSMSDTERYDAIDNAKKKIIKEAEKDRDVKCRIASMFNGQQYILYTYFRIKDVRIVYAPPTDIGAYGGDIDNWMWPRHCGDFAFVRAYVAPDGSSANFSEENIPYKPESFLPISSRGLSEGDFTMLIGFPGRTSRYSSSAYIEYLNDHYYPYYLNIAKNRLTILEEEAAKDPEVAIRLESKKSGINNFYKKSQGTVEGIKRSDIINNKKKIESELTAFIEADPDRKAEFGNILSELDSLYLADVNTFKKDFLLKYVGYTCEYLGMANSIYKWSIEREKDDSDRKSGYQERNYERSKRRLKNRQINLVPSYDNSSMTYFVNNILALPDNQKIHSIEDFFAGVEVQTKVDEIYAATSIGNLDQRMAMFEMSKNELEELNDPFINLAMLLRPAFDKEEERSEAKYGAETRLKPKLMKAYSLWKNGDLYPNANGTKRFNYGQVKGIVPKDAVSFGAFTTLEGIMQKETGEYPFIVCEELKQSILTVAESRYLEPSLNSVPVNVMTTNSGTNGNSGSPIINGKGEFVGIDFDTCYEGVVADYYYDVRYARAIAVDSRYILYLIDEVYNLEGLVGELTIH